MSMKDSYTMDVGGQIQRVPRKGPAPKAKGEHYVRLTVTIHPQLREYVRALAEREGKYVSTVVAEMIMKTKKEKGP